MAPSETPQHIVTRVMYGFLTPGMTYPNTLPADLAPWYCYPADAGHSILAVLTSQVQPGKPVEGALVPMPVKQVLRLGYTTDAAGYVWCDAPHDLYLGLLSEPADEEW
jgi:hypothetical protein